MTHRLALGLKDMKALETFKARFNSLYVQMSGSANKSTKLQEIQNVYQDDQKVNEPHIVRWLQSALEAVNRCNTSVVSTLSELGAEDHIICESFHQYLSASKTAVLTSFMLGGHDELAALSCEFQRDYLGFSEVRSLFENSFRRTQIRVSKIQEKSWSTRGRRGEVLGIRIKLLMR